MLTFIGNVAKKSYGYIVYPVTVHSTNECFQAEVAMPKKKGKLVSFDAMVKFFMHNYNIPTKRDIDGITARLERIERLIASSAVGKNRRGSDSATAKQPAETASDVVLEIIRRYPEGVGFADIKLQTGYEEKKLRNILFRLHKLNKINRRSRGIYIQA
jgi:hypothetical protein